jgi:hypothetical protein
LPSGGDSQAPAAFSSPKGHAVGADILRTIGDGEEGTTEGDSVRRKNRDRAIILTLRLACRTVLVLLPSMTDLAEMVDAMLSEAWQARTL